LQRVEKVVEKGRQRIKPIQNKSKKAMLKVSKSASMKKAKSIYQRKGKAQK
jgi:hypothetical protein